MLTLTVIAAAVRCIMLIKLIEACHCCPLGCICETNSWQINEANPKGASYFCVLFFFFLFVEHSETASVVVHDVLVYISVFNQINDMYCTW